MKIKILCAALLLVLVSCGTTPPKSIGLMKVERIDRRPGTNEALYHLTIVKDLNSSFGAKKQIIGMLIGHTTNKFFRDRLQSSRKFRKNVVCHVYKKGGSIYTIFNVEDADAAKKYVNLED